MRSAFWVFGSLLIVTSAIASDAPEIVMGPNILVSRDGDVAHVESILAINPRNPDNLVGSASGVSVADAIEMNRIQEFAASADGGRFAAVVWRGDLGSNRNLYSFLVFSKDDRVRAGRTPVATVEIAPEQEEHYFDPAISKMSFFDGGRQLAFLGRCGSALRQVHAIDLATGQIRTLTGHAPELQSYSISEDGRTVAFIAADHTESDRRRWGYSVLERGARPPISMLRVPFDDLAGLELFVQRDGSEPKRLFATSEVLAGGPPTDLPPAGYATADSSLWARMVSFSAHVSVSPDGRWAVFWPYAPPGETVNLRAYDFYAKADLAADGGFTPGALRVALPYGMADFATGDVRPLISAPHDVMGDDAGTVIWLGGGDSVVISTLLPLDAGDPAENARRAALPPQLAEVEISTGRVTPVALEPGWTPVGADPATGGLLLTRGAEVARLPKRGGAWADLEPAGAAAELNQQYRPVTNGEIVVGVQDGLQEAPEVVAVQLATGEVSTLTDLNPQLRERSFGVVERITWTNPFGTESFGHLILPLGFTEGTKYPLVVLIDDVPGKSDDASFIIDGRQQLSSFAMQTLAAHGFVVLLTPFPPMDQAVYETPEEGARMFAHIASGIAEVDRRALIDRSRVGLAGWSRAGYHTNKLAMSGLPLAAVILIDGGGSEYGLKGDQFRWFTRDEIMLIGAPLLAFVHNESLHLAFAGFIDELMKLGRPVDYYIFPNGTHNLRTPSERWTSLTVSVDWYRFWLKGEEDADPAKASRYRYWRQLRGLEGAGEGGGP